MSYVQIGSNIVNVSERAATLFRQGGKLKMPNGFSQRIVKANVGSGSVLSQSSKRMPDGTIIEQKLWTWPNGQTAALTEKSDGFLSCVYKNENGQVVSRLISDPARNRFVQEGTHLRYPSGSKTEVPFKIKIDGNNYNYYENNSLIKTRNSSDYADWARQEAIKQAVHNFRIIG